MLPELLHKQIDCNFSVPRDEWFDPCPLKPNFDGLRKPWKKYNKVNCPFDQWFMWVTKAIKEQSKGKTSVVILPASKMSSPKWTDLVIPNAKIITVRGRPSFQNADDLAKPSKPYPGPILICVFYGKGRERMYHTLPIFGGIRAYENYCKKSQKERIAINNFITSKRNATFNLWKISDDGFVERKCSICKKWIILSEKNWTYDGESFKKHSKCAYERKKEGIWKT